MQATPSISPQIITLIARPPFGFHASSRVEEIRKQSFLTHRKVSQSFHGTGTSDRIGLDQQGSAGAESNRDILTHGSDSTVHRARRARMTETRLATGTPHFRHSTF